MGTPIAFLRSLYLAAARRALHEDRGAEAEELLQASLAEGRPEGDAGAQAEPQRLLLGLYLHQAKWAQAEAAAREALAILIPAWTLESPDVEDLLAQLGEALRQQKRYALARPLFEQVLAFNERRVGREHLELVPALRQMADLCLAQKDAAGARAFARRVLDIQEKVLGTQHLEVAQTARRVADLAELCGRMDEAEGLLKWVMEIRAKAFGQAAPAVAEALEALAAHYSLCEAWPQAQAALEQALAIQEKQAGPESPVVLGLLEDLANLQDAKGDDTAAEALRERRHELRKAAKKGKKG
jgi:hypothetical protein